MRLRLELKSFKDHQPPKPSSKNKGRILLVVYRSPKGMPGRRWWAVAFQSDGEDWRSVIHSSTSEQLNSRDTIGWRWVMK